MQLGCSATCSPPADLRRTRADVVLRYDKIRLGGPLLIAVVGSMAKTPAAQATAVLRSSARGRATSTSKLRWSRSSAAGQAVLGMRTFGLGGPGGREAEPGLSVGDSG